MTSLKRLKGGLSWRWRDYVLPRIRPLLGIQEVQWQRVLMYQEIDHYIQSLNPSSLHALEISGSRWRGHGFASYCRIDYPEYDVCAGPLQGEKFDLVIMDQVLEHVLWPLRAVSNVRRMLRSNGVFIVTTPFLIRIHNYPVDCCRWTELGMKHLLAEAGFDFDNIVTGSWGNRACVRGNFRRWKKWMPWKHSLRNEPDFPVVVWAFARKSA